jgi:hypothetical protein
LAPGDLGEFGLQLPREGFGAGKNFPPAGSFKCLRCPLTVFLAPPVPCDRLILPRAMAVARAVAA